jgi:SagB-type dehydrogenase family enzyme
MDRRTFVKAVPALAMMAGASATFAEELKPIVLPKPEKDGGRSVLAALWERRTIREIKEDKLPPQVLSNLLWAAFGVNREAGPTGLPGRTAASASNSQEIDLYVALPEGIYLYEAAAHRLAPVVAGDLRAKASKPGRRSAAVAKAPVSVVFVADLAKYARARFQEPGLKDPEVQKSYYYVATGLIAGNVYLFAASMGLAAWFHNCDKPELAAALKLRPEQRVLFAQTVGYPAKG